MRLEGLLKHRLTPGEKRIDQAGVDAARGQQSKPGVIMPAESARVLQRTEPLGKGGAIKRRRAEVAAETHAQPLRLIMHLCPSG